MRSCAPTRQLAVLPRLFERAFVHHWLKVVTTSFELDRGGGAHRLRPERFAACTEAEERVRQAGSPGVARVSEHEPLTGLRAVTQGPWQRRLAVLPPPPPADVHVHALSRHRVFLLVDGVPVRVHRVAAVAPVIIDAALQRKRRQLARRRRTSCNIKPVIISGLSDYRRPSFLLWLCLHHPFSLVCRIKAENHSQAVNF